MGYVPGPWMQSVQVSKGAASVKNGYESLTGQINIEYKLPQATDGIRGNAYLDSKLRQEINADGSITSTMPFRQAFSPTWKIAKPITMPTAMDSSICLN